ncbi:hypothetical protein ACHAWC_002047, partial [Mediolabrus comicus]
MKPWTALLSFSCLLFVGGHLVNGEDDGDNSGNKEIIGVDVDARPSQHQIRRGSNTQRHLNRQREHPLKSLFGDDGDDGDAVPTFSPTSPCEGPDPENCGCPQLNQTDYRGTISKTISGRTCQNWADRTPHWHNYHPAWYPWSGLDANYCRNPTPSYDDRAWCITTDPNEEWEYCDVPFCPLEPTISPAPTLTKLPSESPTMSVSPSSLPSSSPTFTGGCMNLSVAVLLPAKTFTGLSFMWTVNTTTSDGNEVTWEMPYYLGSSDKEIINSIVVEHANGTNSLDEEICLPAGRYSFGYSTYDSFSGSFSGLTYSENGWG